MDTNDKKKAEPKPSDTIVKLKHPMALNGSTVGELDLDFDKLSSRQQIEAERTYRLVYKDEQPEPIAMTDSRYLLILAGIAAGVNHEDLLLHLKGRDYRSVINRALVFCGGTD